MIQQEVGSPCGCPSCSGRKYQTRSATRLCKYQASKISRSADQAPLGEELSDNRVPSPKPRLQSSFLKGNKYQGQLVSRLLDSIARFWSLFILDNRLPLSLGLSEDNQVTTSSPTSTITTHTTKDEKVTPSLEPNLPRADRSTDADKSPEHSTISSDEEQGERDCTPATTGNYSVTSFSLQNLLLGEELKRLHVWKATFSDDELNHLPAVKHEIAQGVLKCLTGVATILIQGSDEWKMTPGLDNLEAERQTLKQL
ncbi:uncharacterized protein FTOL_01486 [Fusarium torulosum]|uniref:Uncharacterized protein n=1 Tax=Fusarium torulosum TaxID=33205 RepID=A0AAE8SDG3_9HYPO|nr:uncharacterized protein FTOL_01486 [Fusarium torulosum]